MASIQALANVRQAARQPRPTRPKAPSRSAVFHGDARSLVEVMIAPMILLGHGNYTDFAARGSLELKIVLII